MKVREKPPSLLMLGREVELPIDLLYGRQDTPNTPNDSYSVYALNLQSTLFEVHELARAQMLKAGPGKREIMTTMQNSTITMWVTPSRSQISRRRSANFQ